MHDPARRPPAWADIFADFSNGEHIDRGTGGYTYTKGSLATDTGGYLEKDVYSAGSYGCRFTDAGGGMITGNGAGSDDNPISFGGWFALNDKASNYIEFSIGTILNVGAPYVGSVFGSGHWGISEVNSSSRIQKQLSGWLASRSVGELFHIGISYSGNRALSGLNAYFNGILQTPTATADTVDGFAATAYAMNFIGQYCRAKGNSIFYSNKKALSSAEMYAIMTASRGF